MIPRIAGVASRLLVTSRRQYSSSVPSSLIDTSGLTESTIAQLSTSPPPLILLPSFVTENEQSALVIQSQRRLKRILGRKGYARYEPGHFDNVIRNYKEAMISDWGSDLESAICRDIVERIKASVNLPPETVWLDSHILDLASDGEILSHVDHAGYSGGVIAGLSLVSPCVMHFQRKQEHFSILLEPGSLYIQRDFVRKEFAHSIPSKGEFKGQSIQRGQRLSLVLRDKLDTPTDKSLGERFTAPLS